MKCKYCGKDSAADVCHVCSIIKKEAEIKRVPGGMIIRLDRRFLAGGYAENRNQ